MRVRNYCLAGLAVPLTMWATLVLTHAADDGLITKPSRYSVNDTIARFETAVTQRQMIVFTEIDHAAAAKKFGLEMRPRTVILFGAPKRGTPVMVKTPLVAIDFPPKALGKVWLSYYSADYLFKTIYPRHGAGAPPPPWPLTRESEEMSDYATK